MTEMSMDSAKLYSQARKARQDGDRKKTEELFRKLIDLYPDSRETRYAV
jgi:TolA-binding protein